MPRKPAKLARTRLLITLPVEDLDRLKRAVAALQGETPHRCVSRNELICELLAVGLARFEQARADGVDSDA